MKLRAVTGNDADMLLAWRNDPQTRNASHNTSEVPRSEHLEWLARALDDPDRQLFVAEEHGEPVGTVRADLVGSAWNLSWTVAPEARGRGVATKMVAILAEQISDPITAQVRSENPASARVARNAGMKLEKETRGVLYFRRGATA